MPLISGLLTLNGYVHGTQTWVVTDINGDGRNDIVVADAEHVGGRIVWLENLGMDRGTVRCNRHVIAGGLLNKDAEGRWQYHGRAVGGIVGMCVGDFTGDGRPDVATIEQDRDRARRQDVHPVSREPDGPEDGIGYRRSLRQAPRVAMTPSRQRPGHVRGRMRAHALT